VGLGDRFVNRPWDNVVNWTIVIVLFAASLLVAVRVLLPEVIPGAGG
jgi:hypothetical protein